MDPQQRLLLQVTWEAIEDAGIAPSALAGQPVGVYVGASTLDYSIESFFDPSVATGHFMTGNTLSVASNRLSYIYDLNGPSFTVDTACSSSLVALNEAVKALNAGDIDTAIVAGVNALVSPFPFIGFAQATMLSPEGLCRAFDARGMGYVRSEGCVAFILRRQDASQWPGQKAIAEIIGVDINADGRTVGMSLPSQEHQARLLRGIYERSGIDLDDLAFVEAHGTGTRVGDPAEAWSIGTTLAKGRSSALPIGSVKTNIGHLEPASGLAGLAKAVLALENDLLPASLHCEEPNPDIDFEALNLKVATDAVPLPKSGKRRFAGVNSFGFGGTNAHVLLSDPARAALPLDADRPHPGKPQTGRQHPGESNAGLLMLSAKSRDALADLAGRYARTIEGATEKGLGEVQAAAWHRKHPFEEKLVVKGRDPATVADALKAFAAGEKNEAVQAAKQTPVSGSCAFVFSGNGAQWPGMGQAAYRNNPVFRSRFDEISRLFETEAGVSLKDQLFTDDLDETLKLTSTAQPLLFATQVALCSALDAYGLRPDFVLGHSIGEVGAAVVSGAMTLADGVRLVHHRSRAQEDVAGAGTMAALVMPEDEALSALADAGCGAIEIAAVNSPKSISLSGGHEDLEAFGKYARKNHIAFRKVDLNYPFHSSLIDVVEAPFLAAMGKIGGQENATTGFISTVTGELMSGTGLDTAYWWRNLREPVRFKDAVETALGEGVRFFVEIGPRPILQSYIRQTAAQQDANVVNLGSLTAEQDLDHDPVQEIVARLLVNGFTLDQDAVFGANPGCPVSLPLYPWQNQPFHFQSSIESNSGLLRGVEHPLLGWRAREKGNTWTTHIDTQVLPFLADHEIDGQVIFPGAGYVEIGLSIGRNVYGDEPIEIRDMDIVQAMFLDDDHLTELQTQFYPETGTFEICSRRRLADEPWALNAKGRIFTAVDNVLPQKLNGVNVERLPLDAAALYETARSFGLNYGPTFQRAAIIEKVTDTACRIRLKPGIADHEYGLHPAELDACFHGIFALLGDAVALGPDAKAYVPVHFETIQQLRPGAMPAYAEIVARRISSESILVDFVIFDDADAVVAAILGARFRAVKFGLRETSSELVFHYRSEPLAEIDTGDLDPVPGLTAPAEAIALQHHAGDLHPDDEQESESRLLLEAAAQRLAIDVLTVLANVHGAIREQDFPEGLRLYLNALINWLVHVEAAVEAHPGLYELSDIGDLPEFDELIGAVLQEAPEEIAAATLLTRCRAVALSAAEGGEAGFEPSSALQDHLKFASPDALARLTFARQWLDPLLETWPRNRPLRVLDLGGSGLELARYILARLPNGGARVIVADPDAASVSRLSSANDNPSYLDVVDVSKGHDGLKTKGFDLVISSGRLHEFTDLPALLRDIADSNPGSVQFAAIEPERSLLADAVFGLQDGWLESAAGSQFPLSRLRSAPEWDAMLKREAAFETAGFEHAFVKGHPVSVLLGAPSAVSGVGEEQQPGRDEAPFWCIVCDDRKEELACAEALSGRLADRGIRTEILVADGEAFDAGSADDWRDVFSSDAFAQSTEHVLFNIRGASADSAPATDAIARRCLEAIAAATAADGARLRVAFVAPDGSGLAPGSPSQDPAQTAFWTFTRVLANEFPDLDIRRLDIPLGDDADRFAAAALEAMMADADEGEIVARGTSLEVSRVVPGFPERDTAPCEAVTLGFDQPGSLSALSWRAMDRRPPEGNEVEIEVAATGLNFRDVMWSLGMLPEEALEDGYGGPSLGLECSGRVVRTGPDVRDLKAGDPVVAFTRAGFSSHVTVPEFAVAKIDETQDLIGAATIPVAFLTAYYALIRLGGLKEGQWVLLHGGAGGVGLAALQIAKWVGAKVIATAGSDEKRDLLTVLGADHVLDSRSLDFAAEVMALTEGKGVHAVLNSLAGEAMERSIQIVRPFGKFLELGKRDFYENTKIGLRPFRKNVSYFGIDVDQLLSHDLELADELIQAVFDRLREGHFSFLPYRLFDGTSVQDAFRLMQRSGHIGKILVTPQAASEVRVPGKAVPLEFDGDGYHVIVGGLGGFGGEITRWLADHGARRIVVTSRSGATDEKHADLVRTLADDGIEVRAVRCDVTDRIELSAMLEDLRSQAPVKGVIHAAMVLDDGLMTSLDRDRFERVLAPKVAGAAYLDELTRQDGLDYFLLFSSLTTMIGNPGQANYVAANGYLEGLARARRQAALPGLAIGWGAIRDVGFLARNSDVSEKLSKHLGSAMIDAREGLNILAEVMGRDRGHADDAVIHIGRFDWDSVLQNLPLLKQKTFQHLANTQSKSPSQKGALDLAGMIAGKSEKEAMQILCSLLAQELSEILRLPAEEIGFNRPLADFGMDSLMGLELRMGIQKRFGIEIPLVSLSGGTCVEDFAEQILKRFDPAEGGATDHVKDGLVTQHLDVNLTSEQKSIVGQKVEQVDKKVGGLLG